MSKINLVLFLLPLFFMGCTMGNREVGTSKQWSFDKIQLKTTTEKQLLEVFGPPSLIDIKSMKDRTVYYYWVERLKNKSLYLFVYNYWNVDIKYDRAMFVFNKEGILEYYGVSYGNPEKGV